MSEVSLLLSGRILTPLFDAVETTSLAPASTLGTLPVGSSGTITALTDALPAATQRRLADLGFLPGATVTVVRRAPLGGPTVFSLGSYEFALRRNDARAISVVAA